MMKVVHDFADLDAMVGSDVAVSPWLEVTQEQMQRFADATLDWQWIHIDPEKAQKGPFGTTIAHGFLTLSLVPHFFEQSIRFECSSIGINYGVDRVRFPSPVPVGSRLRAHFALKSSEAIAPEGRHLTWLIHIEREGESKPVAVIEFLFRLYR
jgi:acyl dehydratase